MALNRKIAFIDLTTETISLEPIPMEWRRKFVGGRGLDAYLLLTHTPVGCDPLGPENLLILSCGVLTGTAAPSSAAPWSPLLRFRRYSAHDRR